MATERDSKKVKSVAVILAAGSSSRMGQSKQLLKIKSESLLRRTIKTVVDSDVDQVVVVLGSNQQTHQKEIVDLPIQIIYNEKWEKGMGSSIKSGVKFVKDNFQRCESILFAVCDQPRLTADHLKKIIQAFHSENKSIIASHYSNSPCVPALFDRSMFEKLLKIDDQHGAKKIIQDYSKSAHLLDFPGGEVDLDTPNDWETFLKSHR